MAAFDELSDAPVERVADVGPDAVLVFDGLFLQRPELAIHWDLSVLLVADARLERAWLSFLLGDLPEADTARADAIDERLTRARWPRCRDGWRRYVDAVGPAAAATVVIDNDDLTRPVVVRP